MNLSVAMFLYGGIAFCCATISASFASVAWETWDHPERVRSRQTFWLGFGVALDAFTVTIACGFRTLEIAGGENNLTLDLTSELFVLLAGILFSRSIVAYALSIQPVRRKIRVPWFFYIAGVAAWGLAVLWWNRPA